MNYFIIAIGLSLSLLVTNERWCIGTNLNEVKITYKVKYAFRYGVDAGPVVMHHWEERYGDLIIGSYSLLEPTGRIRIVTYKINGKNGFRAVVKYRNPPGKVAKGPLIFPKSHRTPIILAKPVNFITKDLFEMKSTYPNLPPP